MGQDGPVDERCWENWFSERGSMSGPRAHAQDSWGPAPGAGGAPRGWPGVWADLRQHGHHQRSPGWPRPGVAGAGGWGGGGWGSVVHKRISLLQLLRTGCLGPGGPSDPHPPPRQAEPGNCRFPGWEGALRLRPSAPGSTTPSLLRPLWGRGWTQNGRSEMPEH